ncbi:MAG: LytR/AlgR family response regulator transcription factor [Acutalibacteraceae bacterium]
MINFAICEDEIEIAKSIETFIKEHMLILGTDCNIDIFLSGSEFENTSKNYDLIFLDCMLPDAHGLDIARRLRDKGCTSAIIFVTAYEEFVYESFKVNAFRYLLKPIDEQELLSALTSFMSGIEKECIIDVPTKEKTYHLSLNEIMYIESCEKHSIVRVLNDSYESTKTISEFQAEISSHRFFRTHRRYLVNMKYIIDIEKNTIIFSNGEQAEISRRNLSNFNKCYVNYLKYSV